MSTGLSAGQQHRLDELRRMVAERDFADWQITTNDDGTLEIRIEIPTPNGFYDGCDHPVKSGMFTKKRFACWHCPAVGDARDNYDAKAKLTCRQVMYHATSKGPK